MKLAMAPSAASLGIAIGERSIALAEVASSHRRQSLVRSAVFNLPENLSQSDPKTVGEKLRLFLQENHFSARRAVVGLPARWLVAVEKKLPPANEETAAEILRLAAERQFPPESKAMEFDYAGAPDSQQPRNVLLVAAAKQHFDRVMQMLEAAELKPVAVTSSTLVLSSMLDGAGGAGDQRPDMLLTIGNEATELAVMSAQGGPRQLRHLPVSGNHLVSSNGTAASALASLGGELFRTASLGGADAAASNHLLIWDDVGLDPTAATTLGQRSGLKVTTVRDLSRLSVTPPAGNGDQSPSAPAVALAVAGTRGGTLPINFLHSRLAPPKVSRVNPKVLWGSIAGGVVVLGLLAMWFDLHRLQSTFDENSNWLHDQAIKIKEAQDNVAKASFAGGWFSDGRTPVLDCLKYITDKFPQDPSIWATNFTLHDNGKAVLGGRAVDKSEVYHLYDRILADKHFTDVTLPDFHDAGGSSRDYIFSLSFTYKGEAAK